MQRITSNEYRELAEYIKQNYGINLGLHKQALVTGRLHHELEKYKLKTFSEYYKLILSDKSGEIVRALISRITTNHTYFMREADHFDFFREAVMPYLRATIKDRDLRIWSAGCSSGEEPYTLAMIMKDFFKAEKGAWDTKILATDISDKVLDKARAGIYSNAAMDNISPYWKNNYFREYDKGQKVIIDEIKREVVFRKFNLMDKVFPFKKKFNVIFCRNVMIYFDEYTKNQLVNKFYDWLEVGGYLFIGHSESLNRNASQFKYIKPAIYKKE